MIEFPILTLLVLVPAVGSVLVALISKRYPDLVRVAALVASVLTGGLSLWVLFAFKSQNADFQFVSQPVDLTADGTVTWALHSSFAGTTAYVVLTTENGGIVIDDDENTITWTLDDAASSAATWTTATAQLEVEISGVVHRVREYELTLTRETTR